jgi:hypothetical protein
MNIQEKLVSIRAARAEAEKQWADYKEGKSQDKPSVEVKSFDMVEKMLLNTMGDFSKGRVTVQETLHSTDAVKLIPKVIEGQLREAAEPVYLATRFMKTIQVNDGASAVYVIPVVGELTAHEVAEGGRYNESTVDFNTLENGTYEVRVKKIGLKVALTEEAVTDGAWDIMSINIAKMGRAMARYKEEWCFNSFSDHGHVVFDNALRGQMPEAGTSGRAADGSYNDTMSTEDFIDMILAMMGQEHTPTDIIMHPLTWVVFARNSMIGNGMTYGAFGAQDVHPWGATQGTPGFAGLAANQGPQKYILTPDQVQGRLPMPLRINFSPFVRFDKVNKKFDMYALDADNVGIIAQKDALTTDNWTDPERDIRLIKCKERYGVAIIDNGKGIAVARNLAVAPTYPEPPVVTVVNKDGN